MCVMCVRVCVMCVCSTHRLENKKKCACVAASAWKREDLCVYTCVCVYVCYACVCGSYRLEKRCVCKCSWKNDVCVSVAGKTMCMSVAGKKMCVCVSVAVASKKKEEQVCVYIYQ